MEVRGCFGKELGRGEEEKGWWEEDPDGEGSCLAKRKEKTHLSKDQHLYEVERKMIGNYLFVL